MHKLYISFVLLMCGGFLFESRDSSALFDEALDLVTSNYVNETDKDKLLESAISGMLSGLDPHSSYLNATELQAMYNHVDGEFGGIGIEITIGRGFIRIISPIDDTPAFYAGIQSGDYITHVEGESIQEMSVFDAINKMRGEAGTKVNITVLRGEGEVIDFEMIRDVIRPQIVKARMEDHGLMYIRVSTFNKRTTDELVQVFNDLKAEHEIQGLLIDLRNNPGGLLDQAVEMVRLFLKEGEIIKTTSRVEDNVYSYHANGQDITNGLPIVVLINEGSASASEIVAGALQDHHRAIIMGTRSFGKGSIQSIIPLQNNKGALRLTTALYQTSSGHFIQAEGITPDVELCNIATDKANCKNNVYGEKSLPNYIKSVHTEFDDIQPKNIESDNDTDSTELHSTTKNNDNQIIMALQMLHSLVLHDARISIDSD